MPTATSHTGEGTRFTHILDRIRSGDPLAMNDLIKVAADRVYRKAHYYLRGSYRDAARGCETDDLSQIVWITVSRKFTEDSAHIPINTAQCNTFLVTIIKSAARDVALKVRGLKFRTQHPERRHTDEDAPPVVVPSDEDKVERRIEVDAVFERLIAQLPENQRLLIEARFILGWSPQECAAYFKVSTRTLSRWLLDAYEQLRELSGTDIDEALAG